MTIENHHHSGRAGVAVAGLFAWVLDALAAASGAELNPMRNGRH
jgi:hypothetical protein